MNVKKILIVLSIILVPNFIFAIQPVNAIIRDQTIETTAEKDTYAREYNPTTNYGGQSYFLVGRDVFSAAVEAYFYFNFSDKPVNWENAEIALDLYSISSTVNLSVYLIEDSWNELTLTWNNKPTKGEMIDSFLAATEKIYTINVTSYIAGRNNISICLWTPELFTYNQIQGSTREGYFDPPQLIWTYGEIAEITVTTPTSSSKWFEYNTYSIHWTSLGSINDVEIKLYRGSTFIEDISWIGYTSNDGTYDFYVSSAENYKGSTYRVKIIDHDDPNVFDYSDYFSINVGSGTITVTSPSSMSSWAPGSSHFITWLSTGNIVNVDIDIYKGGIQMYYVSGASNDGLYTWTLAEDIEQGTDWRIKISNSDDSGESDWSDYFTISTSVVPSIPGYNFIFMIGIFLLALFPIGKRIKKHI
ncbi:hypothetical protein LCGC14_1726990 [marine sediment metagenome]|uniref:DNRLRE domain-containing protein n=1 Tax=marine sediment metagenome TaxID=412755 RepID=A0A0F9JRB3_9ZZZZ